MFEGKIICPVCNTPKSPEDFGDGDMCVVCAGRHDREIARLNLKNHDGDRFSQSLKELRKLEPAVPTLAEKLLSSLGGAEGQAKRIAEDLKAIRGEDLDEDQRALHTVHWASAVKMHTLVMSILQKRDEMVGDHDPIEDMDERDLNAIVAQGAALRIESDSDFRVYLLNEILKVEPGILDRFMVSDQDGREVSIADSI